MWVMSRRRGLVLGAGGFLGAAWMLGALAAVQEATSWDAREADLMVGTSAGSVLTGLLRAGVSVDDLYGQHCGETVTDRLTALPDSPPAGLPFDLLDEPCWPGLPAFGFGSAPLVARVVKNPRRFSPTAVCAALLPRGRRSPTGIGKLIEDAGQSARWPDGTWVVAMNYHTGARVPFGRPDSPVAPLARAVMASCAVPAWYSPVRIGPVPYIDGSVCSPCNADLLAEAELDEVFVLAPMASVELDSPRSPLAWLERRFRRSVTKRLHRELDELESRGTRVTLLTPNAADLAAMGVNMMDGARREEVLRTARDSVGQHLACPDRPREAAVAASAQLKAPVTAQVKTPVAERIRARATATRTKDVGAGGPLFGAA
jgi:NTE family protein